MGVRTGFVFGAGGVLGLAWMLGCLQALEDERGVAPVGADVLVGTSAGSLLAVLLAAGASVDELIAHQLGRPVRTGPLAGLDVDPDAVVDTRLRAPRPWIGSRRLVLTQLRRPADATPSTVLAGLAPLGRGSLGGLGDFVDMVAPAWPEHPGVEVVAMDYDTGQRAVFASSAAVPPAVAVTASCAIPGWFAPIAAGGRRYVDGGAVSVTSADLLAARRLDEVFVLAPMAAAPRDRSLSGWLVRGWRRHEIRQTHREVAMLRAAGVAVTLVVPSATDLTIAGPNLMASGRRRAVLESSLRTSRTALRGGEWLQPHAA